MAIFCFKCNHISALLYQGLVLPGGKPVPSAPELLLLRLCSSVLR